MSEVQTGSEKQVKKIRSKKCLKKVKICYVDDVMKQKSKYIWAKNVLEKKSKKDLVGKC